MYRCDNATTEWTVYVAPQGQSESHSPATVKWQIPPPPLSSRLTSHPTTEFAHSMQGYLSDFFIVASILSLMKLLENPSEMLDMVRKELSWSALTRSQGFYQLAWLLLWVRALQINSFLAMSNISLGFPRSFIRDKVLASKKKSLIW